MTVVERFTTSPAERAAAQMRQIANEVDPSERAEFLSALREGSDVTASTPPADWHAEREAMSSRLDAYFVAHPEADMTTAILALERGAA